MRHTHSFIKSKFVRRMYAEELNAMRKHIKPADRHDEMWRGVLFGIESAFWKIEQAIR